MSVFVGLIVVTGLVGLAGIGRIQLVYLATEWAIDLSCSLQDAAHARGDDWRPFIDALDMDAAYAWRSIFNPLRWRYAHFYPELARLAASEAARTHGNKRREPVEVGR